MNAGEIIAGQKFAGLMFADLPRIRKHLSRKVTLMKAEPQTFACYLPATRKKCLISFAPLSSFEFLFPAPSDFRFFATH